MSDTDRTTERLTDGDAVLRTFLIADVRGYTSFTQGHGDEMAAALARRFAGITREHIAANGGRVVELRGDEALAVFASARQAIRAAIDLQTTYVAETEADPSLPLAVGIGLDAGEAVPVEDGFRGGALNLAARLCSQAGPGEVLASQEVIHLARTMPGVRYEQRPEVRLKGLDTPVRAVRVAPQGPDLRARLAPFVTKPTPTPRARSSKKRVAVIAAVVGVAAVAATLVPILISRGGGSNGLSGVAADSIGTIDTRTGAIEQQVNLGVVPYAIAVQGNTAWVTSETDGTVSRIDLPGGSHQKIHQVGTDPTGVAVGYQAVWVTDSVGRSVARINTATNTVVQTTFVGDGPRAVATGAGGVWVANSLDDTVMEIDPGTGVPSRTIAVGGTPVAIVVGAGAVWTANETDGTVSRIDGGTAPVARPIPVGGAGLDAIAFDGTAVWVANGLTGTVSRIDPATNNVTDTIPVGTDPSALAVGGGALWVTDAFDASVSKIDLATGRVIDRIDVGSAATGAAVGGGSLWVSTHGAGAAHAGGTLRIAGVKGYGPTSLDPAVIGLTTACPLTPMLYDTLVVYKKVGGIDGTTLVADLASSIPTPTGEGTTYTFSLRPNILYSDGTPVRASDVKSSFERAYRLAPQDAGRLAFSGIVGADRCSKRHCDLRGISTDDATGTVTFHLRSADPEFLYKLANTPAWIVSASTPAVDVGLHAPAGTGPYIVQTASSTGVTLVRNKEFHVWSAPAQPAGIPDRIVWTADSTADDAVAAVEAGRADYFGLAGEYPSKARVAEVETRYTAQVHTYPVNGAWALYPNTQVAPFDDPRVRQALAYAIDRTKLAQLYEQQAVVTCQSIPPNFLGYEPYCRYTVSQNAAGTWKAPDMGKATALVEASGTKGDAITMWTEPEFEAPSRYVVTVLNDLGYRAKLHVLADFGAMWSYVTDSRNRAQISGYWNIVQDPLPSELIVPTLTCDSIELRSVNNNNTSFFCDPRIDAQVKVALQTEVTNPQLSRETWAKVDRDLVDAAPVIPLVIPQNLDFVSIRVGNYQNNPAWGVLLDQLWVG